MSQDRIDEHSEGVMRTALDQAAEDHAAAGATFVPPRGGSRADGPIDGFAPQHTPPPWHDTGLPKEYDIVIAGDGPSNVCRIPRQSINAQANARLIKAAPDMLAALEAAQPHIDRQAYVWSAGDSPETFHGTKLWITDIVAAAISKARGDA